MKLLLLALLLLNNMVMASDHVDGPVTMKHGVADIADLYAFTSVDATSKLNLILNVYPMVSYRGHFSEKVKYVFLLRKFFYDSVTREYSTYDEHKIECSFQNIHTHNYSVKCSGGGDLENSGKVGKVLNSSKMQLFTGRVSDPFFLNHSWVSGTVEKGELDEPEDDNLMAKLNVLSIVIEVDLKDIFKNYQNEMIAVAAKSLTKDSHDKNWKQLDWIGRPELTNFTTIPNSHFGELRDMYNKESPFQRPMANELLYRERLEKNILSHYDAQDGEKNWSKDKVGLLVDLLLNDYLILAPGKSCGEDDYFTIEESILEGKEVDRCGGRKLTDDVVDKILSLYITANIHSLEDGVHRPYKEPSSTFPFMAKPAKGVSAWFKSWLIRTFK